MPSRSGSADFPEACYLLRQSDIVKREQAKGRKNQNSVLLAAVRQEKNFIEGVWLVVVTSPSPSPRRFQWVVAVLLIAVVELVAARLLLLVAVAV